MESKKIILKDDRGRDYVVEDIVLFEAHLNDYHASGVSLHEEYGYYFTVDDAFRLKIRELLKEAEGES